ncbi:hypothetical protein [Flavobacterium solisilvae]|uniref:TonB-dependent receptor plug domain-containing protein n=1 Tax=Flavobacterium solisilvae TaxID=1852019 RepID=A0ABX1QVE2_9FLAO|nr:hypothetical protein [Flavobacterium solisilvae]NMH24897.1 hypothetical protein [Flavobacterium solisilvae]
MENQDKLYNQFKSAAENAETKDFPGMENVWNRVEQKLDTKVLKKETKLWKKLAVAASILLVVSVSYHFWSNEKTITTPTNEIVTNDSITKPNVVNENSNAVADVEKHPAIKENAEQILKEQTKTADVIVMNDTVKPKKMAAPMPAAVSEAVVENDEIKKEKEETNSYNGYLSKEVFDARSVKNNSQKTMMNSKGRMTEAKMKSSIKEEPLLVIDNVAEDLQKLGKLDANDVESIIVLPDPLYIINGVEYSEKEVFGPNPTSPYSPLNQQDIETISILQKEKATEIYGKKGEKGVVIITTKNGKPKLKK